MQTNAHSRHFFYILLAVTLIAGGIFLKAYLGVVAFAVVLGFLFHPLYAWLETICRGKQWAAVPLALIGVALTFVLPIALAGLLVANVVSDFLKNVSLTELSSSFALPVIVPKLNTLINSLPGVNYNLTVDTASGWLVQIAQALQHSVVNSLKGLGGTLGVVVPSFFITVYVIGAVFTRYHRISQYLHRLSPLDDKIDSLYAKRITSMIVSMVRGTFVIAVIQGLFTALFLWVAGVPYAAFFGLLATFLSIIPLGAGVILVPAGIILILTGNVWQGLLQIIGYFGLVANVDNILRPRLVAKDASLHPALTLIGVFAGLAQFGFLGVIYGPVVMVILVTTLEVYREHFAPRG